MEEITYRSDVALTPTQFTDLLKRSTLDQRRPVNDPKRIELMLQHGNILITAWLGDMLVGVSRALSDFSYCCYLSDLAVDEAFQHKGIGKKLIEETHAVSGPDTMLILLAAPAAVTYYPKVGMKKFDHCFIINRRTI